jgi:hypothetical protein
MKNLLPFCLILFIVSQLQAQPKPGDLFREYTWSVTPAMNREPYVRVCGDGYYEDQTRKGNDLYAPGTVVDGWFTLPQNLDLAGATRAEVLIERMLCHDGSTGLAVKFNEGGWHTLPDADSIPKPQAEYLYHYYPIVSVPLSELKTGAGANRFRFTLDAKQRWGMPQNMVYGMVVRVYYGGNKPFTNATVATLKPGDVLGESVALDVKAGNPVVKVEYVGLYEGVNLEGDGQYRQWHYNYHRGELVNHIGTSVTGPLTWRTDWIPDQPQPMQIAARVTYPNGLIYMTPTA